jgi:hypothetical protein
MNSDMKGPWTLPTMVTENPAGVQATGVQGQHICTTTVNLKSELKKQPDNLTVNINPN